MKEKVRMEICIYRGANGGNARQSSGSRRRTQVDKNWDEITNMVAGLAQKRAARKLSLNGWAEVTNTYIVSVIYYRWTVVRCLRSCISLLGRLDFKFVWRAGDAAVNDVQTCTEVATSLNNLPKGWTGVVIVCQTGLSLARLLEWAVNGFTNGCNTYTELTLFPKGDLVSKVTRDPWHLCKLFWATVW